jgi:hypothetical protein
MPEVLLGRFATAMKIAINTTTETTVAMIGQ